MSDLLPGEIRLRDVSRSFRIVHDRNLTLKETILRGRRARYTERWALRNVDLDIRPGEAVGVVGENGSGKSTLLKVVAGILPPQTGDVQVAGTVASMLELGAGFHPDFNGRENVFMNGAILGLSERQVAERFDEIVAFAELADSIDMPVRTYSSGMTMRLAFSIASHINPQILLLDEVLAVGDEAFQRKCMGRMFEFRRSGGTLVFVSHDASSVERICDRAILLSDGVVIEDGTPSQVLTTYHKRLSRREGKAEQPPAAREVKGADEWGTGRVRVENVRIEGPNGAATTFASGDAIAVVFDVVPSEPVLQPCYGVAFWTVDDVLVWGTNTNLDAFATEVLDARRTVRIGISDLPLHDGRFVLHLSANSTDVSEIYHELRRCLEFSVFAQASGIGIVRISADWSVSGNRDASDEEPPAVLGQPRSR